MRKCVLCHMRTTKGQISGILYKKNSGIRVTPFHGLDNLNGKGFIIELALARVARSDTRYDRSLKPLGMALHG